MHRARVHAGARPRGRSHARGGGVDVTAVDILAELDELLRANDIRFCFAELKDPVKDKLKRFGLFPLLGEDSFFPTIEAAVGKYVATHQVDWR